MSSAEKTATSDQARDLLKQIEGVSTRGEPFLDRFFFVDKTETVPQSVAEQFPKPEDPHSRIEFAYLFAHLFEPAEDGLAGMLTLSQLEYKGTDLQYDSSIIYKVLVSAGVHSLEQEIAFSKGSDRGIRIFDSEDTEAIAAYETKLAREAAAEKEARQAERPLGLLSVSQVVANDLIAFAEQLNPHSS